MTSNLSNPAVTGRRLGLLLGSYLAAVVVVITLAPFRLDPGRAIDIRWIVADGWAADAALNVALFIPLGVAWQRTTRGPLIRAVLVAAMVSTAIEAAQVFIAPRFTTASDILANTLGAALGAWSSRLLDRRFGTGQAVVGRLMLDLPLMGLVYLLIPLLWLDGIGAHPGDARALMLVPLGVAGSLALAAVARTVPAAGHTAVARNVVLAAGGWYAIGAIPAVRTNAWAAALGLLATLVAAWVGQWGWERAVRADRRLEPQVVRVIVPLLCAYLLAIGANSDGVLDGAPGDMRIDILRTLEQLGACATVAYLLAEWRGRRSESERLALVVPVACVLVLVAIILMVVGRGTMMPRLAASGLAAAFGATLYRRQLDHVVALRAPTSAR